MNRLFLGVDFPLAVNFFQRDRFGFALDGDFGLVAVDLFLGLLQLVDVGLEFRFRLFAVFVIGGEDADHNAVDRAGLIRGVFIGLFDIAVDDGLRPFHRYISRRVAASGENEETGERQQHGRQFFHRDSFPGFSRF